MFDGNGLAALVAAGMISMAVVGIFVPPVVVTGLVWLIGPRFGFEPNVLWWFLGSLAIWVPAFWAWVKFS